MPPKPKKKPTTDKESSSPPGFQVSDKVFAPASDCPVWPAKIIKLYTNYKSKSAKSKCQVYYYGRREKGKKGGEKIEGWLVCENFYRATGSRKWIGTYS